MTHPTLHRTTPPSQRKIRERESKKNHLYLLRSITLNEGQRRCQRHRCRSPHSTIRQKNRPQKLFLAVKCHSRLCNKYLREVAGGGRPPLPPPLTPSGPLLAPFWPPLATPAPSSGVLLLSMENANRRPSRNPPRWRVECLPPPSHPTHPPISSPLYLPLSISLYIQ